MARFKGGTKDAAPVEQTGPAEAPVGESAAECMRVGQLLVESATLDAESLASSLAHARGDLLVFAETVMTRHGASRGEVSAAISTVTGIPLADTKGIVIGDDDRGLLPEAVARANMALVVGHDGDTATVLLVDPSPTRRSAIESALGRRVEYRVADPSTVRTFIDSMYRADADIDRLVKTIETSDEQVRVATNAAEVNLDDQAPVVQVVNRIVSQALRDRASDIHLEPLDDKLRIRFRIDGHLVEAFSLPVGANAALVSRLKIMSGMNIVEKRRPQDGQFSTTVDGRDVDVRVASVATVFGEKIVMRILDKSRSMIGLSELGFPRETYLHYSKMIHSPFGMVICAGPTGAGKTTTLYASLLEVNSSGKNITTVEDPVEYVFPGINQIQTNEQAGLTFATGLKAILRQDPDVILVGEIRDVDTARIAVQSALTGHLVLSSLHGTDSVAALHRFLDMGIEAFLIASSVVGVIGQRLLRRVCDSCKEPYTPGPDELAVFRQHGGGSDKSTFYRGAGCNFCAGTGYRDRIGVYELLRITPEIRRLIVGWATTEELRRLAVAQGMRTMLREAMSLVENDVTTIPEVVRTLFAS
ncbi:MAG: GspE/PulE family protein [Ilumatobacteraceae bacterium]